MSDRYSGGIIRAVPVSPTSSSASGIWTMEQQAKAEAAGNWPVPVVPDEYFKQTTLLLHGDAQGASQNNTFVDSSSNGFTVTRNGNTTQGTFSPFSQPDGYWSNWFGGVSGNYLATSSAGSSVNFGTSNFTFECWLNAASTAGLNFVLDARSTGTQDNLCFLIVDGYWLWQYAGSNLIYTNSNMISAGTWNHVAFVRNSGTLSLYVNGALVTSVSDSTNYAAASASGRPGIGGGGYNTTNIFNGYISNLRLVKGRAVYTSAFTPSTSPLGITSGGEDPPQGTETSLLICQSNRFVDNSSNGFVITPAGSSSVQSFGPFAPTAAYDPAVNGGSGYFDGSGDYLTLNNDTDFAFGTGDFTIECWVNWTYTQYNGIVTTSTTSQDSGSWLLGYSNTANYMGFCYDLPGFNFIGADFSAYHRSWTHVAVTRSGTNLRLFFNGSLVASTTNSTNFSYSSGSLKIGQRWSNQDNYSTTGWLSNLRIVKGRAVYTSAFTPPTAPLGITSGGEDPPQGTETSLLCSFTNAGIIDSTGRNNLETVGNAAVSTSTLKYGDGSMAFDGSGDYLIVPSSPNSAFGNGDYTIEFWVYFSAINSNNTVFDGRTASLQAVPAIIYYSGLGWYYFVNSSTLVSGGSASTSTWYHVAVCRSGTSTKMFINGSQIGSTATDTNTYVASPLTIGARYDNTENLNGYFDDLRITKGVARYPTEPFPTKAFPDL